MKFTRLITLFFTLLTFVGLIAPAHGSIRAFTQTAARDSNNCSTELRALADATIDERAPDTNFGNRRTLEVRDGQRGVYSLLAFDLDHLGRDVVIHEAWLELTLSTSAVGRSDDFRVSNVVDRWREETVTWNTSPRFQANRQVTPHRIGREQISFDVTTLVRSWQSNQRLSQSMLIQAASNGVDVAFHSSEVPSATRQPRLVIRCTIATNNSPRDTTRLENNRESAIAQLQLESTATVDMQIERGAVQHISFDLLVPDEAGNNSISRADWVLAQQKGLLGLDEPATELQLDRISPSGDMVFYRQRHEGIPVYGAIVGVRLNGRQAKFIIGNYVPSFITTSDPTITASEAEAVALELAGLEADVVGETQLRYYNPAILGKEDDRIYLTWLVNLSVGGIAQGYLIDAATSQLRFVEPREEDIDLAIYNTNGLKKELSCSIMAQVSELWATENGKLGPPDSDKDAAWDHINFVFDHWSNNYNLHSYNGLNGKISMFLHLSNGNASANGGGCMKFRTGWVTRDIVGHEFTHEVDRSFGSLIYQDQSGALDESFADIFGHFVDPDDWLIGEGSPNGSFRDMSDPPSESSSFDLDDDGTIDQTCTHPDHTDDYCFTTADYGGVHINNGIHNKVAYLITDGDFFRGYDITGLGEFKAQRLFFRVLTSCLFSSSQFIHARACAIEQAQEWVDDGGTYGFTQDNVCQVLNAYAAVGIGIGDSDCDGVLDNVDSFVDTDGDGKPDSEDNCPFTYNSWQTNSDNDLFGDACDDNDDNDLFPDSSDNCPLVSNDDQANWNSDEDDVGDVCDDTDLDGDLDSEDNCITVFNPSQSDLDTDGIGDSCDADIDGDGVSNFIEPRDNCPLVYNPDQESADLDQIGDACDLCPGFPSNINTDFDNDGVGDPCDSDADGDNVDDGIDNCLWLWNPSQADVDQNGIGFHCDPAEQQKLEAPIEAAVFIHETIPLRIPIVVCPNCASQLPIDWQVSINFALDVPAYAHIVDSQGEIVVHNEGFAGEMQELLFAPAPHSIRGTETGRSHESSRRQIADDETGYFLEITPLDGLGGDRIYTLTWDKTQGVTSYDLFLPLAIINE